VPDYPLKTFGEKRKVHLIGLFNESLKVIKRFLQTMAHFKEEIQS